MREINVWKIKKMQAGRWQILRLKCMVLYSLCMTVTEQVVIVEIKMESIQDQTKGGV